MFDLKEFPQRSPHEILDTHKALSLTRDELVLARHLKIEQKISSTKPEVRQLIIPALIDTQIVEDDDTIMMIEKQDDTGSNTVVVNTREYDREFELEKLKLQIAERAAERVSKRKNC